jgi:N-acyl-D-amino-acid deacylase
MQPTNSDRLKLLVRSRSHRRYRATFEKPHQLSTGVRDVWVNGIRVWRNGHHTGATPGRALYGPGGTASGGVAAR